MMLFSIVSAWWLFATGKNKELMKERLKVCTPCTYRVGFVCGNCGCVLKAKASDPEEECPKSKWVK